MYDKTIIEFSLWFSPLEMYNKLDLVFVMCKIINVSVRVISLADNSYLDIDNSAYHKNFIQ